MLCRAPSTPISDPQVSSPAVPLSSDENRFSECLTSGGQEMLETPRGSGTHEPERPAPEDCYDEVTARALPLSVSVQQELCQIVRALSLQRQRDILSHPFALELALERTTALLDGDGSVQKPRLEGLQLRGQLEALLEKTWATIEQAHENPAILFVLNVRLEENAEILLAIHENPELDVLRHADLSLVRIRIREEANDLRRTGGSRWDRPIPLSISETLDQKICEAEAALEKPVAELAFRNLRLVYSTARPFRKLGLSMKELVTAGNVGLVEAIYRYNPERGALSTYATHYIRKEILAALRNEGRDFPSRDSSGGYRSVHRFSELETTDRKRSSFADFAHKHSQDPRVAGDQKAQSERLALLLDAIPEPARAIIQLRYMLSSPASSSQISQEVGLSVDRLRQAEARTLAFLNAALRECTVEAEEHRAALEAICASSRLGAARNRANPLNARQEAIPA
ncbi:MAG: sigma-70 family RNA polymerase sigma factor [Deltaproteobacteria bacterium]|nr:sigma-70 family RNA polymerase sigma factor [Deltaproteobacteria bacterium]